MNKTIYLIGVGMGAVDNITAKGMSLVKECHEIYAPKRLADMYRAVRADIYETSVTNTKELLVASSKMKIGVLISGDTGFYSIAKGLYMELSPKYNVEMVSGINSLQYLTAKIGADYTDFLVVSLHGRSRSILGAVSYNKNVFVLTGGKYKAHEICKELAGQGLGSVNVIAGENLSASNERIIRGAASELASETFADLTSLIIINENFADRFYINKDHDFIRGNVPMTKEEIRLLCVAKMSPRPDDIIYDIGAGTGSVSIELGKKTFDGTVYAIERDEEGLSLINQNIKKFGTYNVLVVSGEAPDAINELPIPDKVFIGGSGGNMKSIINILINKNKAIKIMVTAITLETLSEIVNIANEYCLEHDTVCLNVSKNKQVGGYNMMIAQNPVYIISLGGNIGSK